jgi:hypothetical protein
MFFDYAPQITNNTNVPAWNFGYLVNETDQPILPEECHDAIWMLAVALLWPKVREVGGGIEYMKMWHEECVRLIDTYARSSQGDKIGFRDKASMLSTSGLAGGWFGS